MNKHKPKWKSCGKREMFFFQKLLIYIFSTLLSEISFDYDFNGEMPNLLRLAHQIDPICILGHVECNINYNQKLSTYTTKNFNVKILEEINSNMNILTFPTFFHYTFVIDNLISKKSSFSDFKKKLFSELSEILYINVEYLEQKQMFCKAFDNTQNSIYLFELIYTPLVQIKCVKFLDRKFINFKKIIYIMVIEFVKQENMQLPRNFYIKFGENCMMV
ncbi:hypothetical protein COBT_003130 [Conglomerata obtusa]